MDGRADEADHGQHDTGSESSSSPAHTPTQSTPAGDIGTVATVEPASTQEHPADQPIDAPSDIEPEASRPSYIDPSAHPAHNTSPSLPSSAQVTAIESKSIRRKRVSPLGRLLGWRKEYRVPLKQLSWWLQPVGLACLAAFNAAILLVIIALWVASTVKDGFAQVSFAPALYQQRGRLPWDVSFLWKTLPSLFMQIPVFLWAAMESQLKKSQPFMEMTRSRAARPRTPQVPRHQSQPAAANGQNGDGGVEGPEVADAGLHGSTVKRTLLLDYNDYFIGQDAWKAFRNGHHVMCLTMIVRLLLLLSAGLAASLFAVASVDASSQINVAVSNSFQDYYSNLLPDMQTLFDQVSDTLVSNLTDYPWTTRNYSLAPFDIVDASDISGTVTATVQAISSNLSCVSIPQESIGFSATASNVSNNVNVTEWSIGATFTDRNCRTSVSLAVDADTERYMHAWTELSCSNIPSSDPSSRRMGLFAGDFDDAQQTKLANVSLISCIPTAWNSTVSATLSITPNMFGQVSAIDLATSVPFASSLLDRLIQRLPDVRYLGSGPFAASTNSTTLDLDGLGRLVYNYAQGQKNSTNPFATEALQTALESVWPAVWAIFVTRGAWDPASKTVNVDAVLTAPDTRLLVTDFSAALMVAFLAITLLALLCVAVYCHRNLPRLVQSTDSLLGHALLLERSPDVGDFLTELRKNGAGTPGYSSQADVDFVKHAVKKHELHSWHCALDIADDTKAGKGGQRYPVLRLGKPDAPDADREPSQQAGEAPPSEPNISSS